MRPLPRRPLLLFAVAALVVSFAVPALAQRRAPRTFPAGLAEARLVRERAEKIGVDDETLKKLDLLVAEVNAEEKELRQRMTEANVNVRALLDQPRPTEEALLAAAARVADVGRPTRMLRLQTSLRVRALLTDEQLTKFMEIRQKALGPRRNKGGGKAGRPVGRNALPETGKAADTPAADTPDAAETPDASESSDTADAPDAAEPGR